MAKGIKGFQKGHPDFTKNKGRKFTKEHRKKLSNARKRFFENGGKHPRPMLGKKMSDETKEKMSIVHKARREKNNFWKGGITPIVNQVRNCFKYRQWRSDISTRDNYTCQKCNAKSGNGKAVYLEADHYPESFSSIFNKNKIKSLQEALNCEELWNINNGRTLCEECHYKIKKLN